VRPRAILRGVLVNSGAVSVAVGRGAVCAQHRTSLTLWLLALRTVLGSTGDEAAPEFQYRIQLALMDTSFQVRV
jgi:predicted deacetylase